MSSTFIPRAPSVLKRPSSEPRLAPYRYQMRQALADALGCSMGQMSLKATTTDGLGALGRHEGVLALATVLLWREADP